MSSTDESLRAQLQQIRRRANLVRDAALALELDTVRESDLPGLIAALQDSFTDLQLALAERAASDGTSSHIVGMRAEWPVDHTTAPWPPEPREPRPRKTGKRGDASEPGK